MTQKQKTTFAERYREVILRDCRQSPSDYGRTRRRVSWTFALVFGLLLLVGGFALAGEIPSTLRYTYNLYKIYLKFPDSFIASIIESYNMLLLFGFLGTILLLLISLRLYTYDLLQRNQVIRELLEGQTAVADPATNPPDSNKA